MGPTVLLRDPGFTRVVTRYHGHFNVVLVSAPPLNDITSSLGVTARYSNAILVAVYNRAPHELITGSIRRLGHANAPLLNIILGTTGAGNSGLCCGGCCKGAKCCCKKNPL